MTAQTLEQKRARDALRRIKELESEPGNYVNYVKALPATILTNGLGQALATECAATDKGHHKLADHLACWLLSEEAHTRYGRAVEGEGEKGSARTLLHRIVEGDQSAYLWAQAEAIAYLAWLKRFADAFLERSLSADGADG